MAWQDEMVTMLRYLINDVSDTPTYTDERLEQVIVIAAQYVVQEVGFRTTYTITITPPTISPDPTEGTPKDLAFMNLVSLKAACLMDNWGYRQQMSVAGISVVSGSDTVSTSGQLRGYQWILQNGACKGYEEAKWQYKSGNLCPGRAILGPFAGWNIDTDDGGLATRVRG